MRIENCDITFSFNKASIVDPSIPAWTLKAKGQTFYVKHVDFDCPCSTKETPSNEHTKGSIKFRRCNLVIEDDGNATITRSNNE